LLVKLIGLYFIVMIVGCILVTGCVLKPTDDNGNPIIVPAGTSTVGTTPGGSLKNPVFGEHLQNLPFGQLNVSIGNYNARLPVYVDNIEAGVVSAGNMLNLKIVEGNHTIKVCSGDVCEIVVVNILSATKTTVDFEERINRDLPLGTLKVSIGDYNAILPVYIDNSSVGNVSPVNTLNQVLSPGNHSVKICSVDNCYTEDAQITPRNQTTIDFGNQLKSGIRQVDLMVSIGGYSAQQLPFFVDNKSAGFVSQGTPVTIKVDTGVHEVKVCSGLVCVKEQVAAKFGAPNYVDFGDQLKKSVEFSKPTVRIVDFSISGDNLNINVEFINPGTTDLTMKATVSCVYSYVNQYHERASNSARTQVTTIVKAGERSTQPVYMWLQGGTDTIASDPVLADISIK
jgi:hypothetical protein